MLNKYCTSAFSLQYQKEIERLQTNVQILKLKLEQAEHQLECEPDSPEVIDNEPDNMKNIIARSVILT